MKNKIFLLFTAFLLHTFTVYAQCDVTLNVNITNATCNNNDGQIKVTLTGPDASFIDLLTAQYKIESVILGGYSTSFELWTNQTYSQVPAGEYVLTMEAYCYKNGFPQVVLISNHSVIVGGMPAPPMASTPQTFCDPNSTLADIEITGSGIVWYDAAIGGNMLPSSTALTTTPTVYYAVQSANQCESSRIGVLAYINSIQPPIITGNNNLCLNNTTQLTGFPAGGTWKSIYTSVATVNSTGLVTAISPGTAEIRYIAHSTEGCTDSISKMITINPLPFPDFSFTGIVYGQTTTFNNTTPGSITSYNWDFGDGSTSTEASPSHIYNAAGSYKVKLKATNSNGCTDSIIKTVIIDKAQLAVTVDAGQQKVYGQPDPLAYTYSTTGWQYSDGDFLLTGKLERAPGDNVGTYNIVQGNLSAGTNYTISFTGSNFEITKATLSVTANVGQSKVYGQPDPLAYTFSVTGWQYSDGESLLTGKLERAPGDNVGTYNIVQGNLSAGTNYAISFTGNDFEITKATLSVTANVGQSKVYGQPDPLAFTFSTTGWQYSDGDFLLTGKLERAPGDNVGTYNIVQGNLSAGTNYAISFTGSNFEITKATLSVTANLGQSKVYGQPDPLAYTYSTTGWQYSDGDFLLTGKLERVPGDNVGTYNILQGNLSAGSNYTIDFTGNHFEITKATLSVTANVGQNKVFGQPDPPAYTFSTTGWQYSDGDFLLTGKLERVPGDNVGTYNILQGNLSAGSNYTIDFTGNHFEITKATLSVTANVGQNKVYGQPDPPAYTFSATGWQYSDGDFLLTGKLERVPGDNVGTYNILQGNLSAGSNYTIDFTGNHFEITKATLSVTANVGQNKVFGQPDPPAYTFSATGWQYSDGESLLTGKLERVPGDNVGTYNIVQGNLSAGTNYAISFTGNDFEITKATLSVTANVGQNKVFGQPDPPAYTYSTTGWQYSDGDFLLTGKLERVPGDNVGTYNILQGNLSAGSNYTIDFTGNHFEITKATLSVTANVGQNKVFGQPDPPAYTFSTTGWQYSDGDFLLTGKLERVPGDNVGTYNILQGNLSAGSNYTIDFTGNHFEITKATLSVTANVGQNKVYGQPDPPAYTFSATGWQYSDGDFLLTGKLERVPGDNVGTYNILQGNLSAGSNYTIDFTGNHFEITKATLSVTANVGQNKVFGQPDPPAYTFSATGWQYSDGESLLTGKLERVPGDNVGTYNILQGNLSAGTNYTIDFTGSNFEITKATLSVTANVGQSKVYGQPDPILNYQLTNGQLFGTDSLIGNLSRTPGEDAGNYPIILGSLTVNDGNNGLNYEIKFIPADFEIIKATQTISFNALPDVYSNASPFILTAVSSSGLPVSYTSSNTDAASVTPDGKVTIHSIGETTITASQPGNNNYHAAADVQQTLKVLPVEAASIAIYPQESRIRIGETIQLHATIQPPNTTDKTINWSSSNTDIANVDANGLITGKAYGTVTITATTSNGLRATATIHVHTIDIKDDVKPSQGFSPDGDGENDYWIVDGIEKHPKNDLYIFDRGGKLHYSVKNYKNNWDGIANVGPYKGRKVPPGTYYYVLKIDDVHMKRSFIVIKY